MELRTNDDISTEQIEDSSNSPPQKRAKRQPGDNLQQVLMQKPEYVVNKPSNNSDNMINQQLSRKRHIQLYSPFGERLCSGS